MAEGSARWSKKDQARYYEISFGSLIEILNQLILSVDLGFLHEAQLSGLREKIDQVGRMLNALYQSTNKPINKSSNKPINKS